MSKKAGEAKAPLEDMMIAMDVVDTLRHRDQLVDRELDTEARRERLIDRLRDIYKAQGITVTDEVLEEGVLALEEDRFAYQRHGDGLQRWLARLYVSRSRWLKPLVFFGVIAALLFTLFKVFIDAPRTREIEQLPEQLRARYELIQSQAAENSVEEHALQLYNQGRGFVSREDYSAAGDIIDDMDNLLSHVQNSYDIRVVNRPGEQSGVFRIPDANTNARNYYLIVEAVNASGDIVSVPVVSEEESGSAELVDKWGLRVSQEVYDRVAADKQDDGIIQDNFVGDKPVGFENNRYTIATAGAAITDW